MKDSNRGLVGTAMTGVGQPYLGTSAFTAADGHRFFGRASEAARLANLWQTNRLTIMHGAAGSGKTSLLGAGVLPLLRDARAQILPPGPLRGNADLPIAAVPRHNPFTLAVLRAWAPGQTVTSLVGLTVHDFLQRLADRHRGTILAPLDRAEDLLAETGQRRVQARQFMAELAIAVRQQPQVHLLLSVRTDALDRFRDALGGGPSFGVPPLSPDNALVAVTGPARTGGRSFAPEAAERLVGDLQTARLVSVEGQEQVIRLDHVDPALLQVVCSRLWSLLPADTSVISALDVRRHGVADAALTEHVSRVIAEVAAEHGLAASRVRAWLTRCSVTEAGTRKVFDEGVRDTEGLPNQAVRALEDRHILSAELRSGWRRYELMSDRLLGPVRRATDDVEPAADPARHLQEAWRAFLVGDLDTAGRLADLVLAEAADTDLRRHAEANSLLANLFCELGKPLDAETHYMTAARLYETLRDTRAVARHLAATGQMMLAQDRPADAVKELRAAVRRLPNDLTIQTALGWALWRLGDLRAGIAILDDVLAADGQNPDALRARGEMLADLDDAHDAIRDLDRVGRQAQPSARAARGLALARLGQHRAADEEIDAALEDAPQNGPVLLYAARAEAISGHRIAAVELAERAMHATDPALPRHQREMAQDLVSQDQGDP